MGKTTILVSCLDQQLTVTDGPIIASGGRNEDDILFDFCPLWDGFEKVAVFYRDGSEAYQVAIAENRCTIPHEVLQTEGFIYFGVFGVKGDAIRTTEVLKYKIVKGALTEATEPADPTPDIYQQYIDIAGDLSSDVAQVVRQLDFGYGYLANSGNPITFGDVAFTGAGVCIDQQLDCVTTFTPVQPDEGDQTPDNVKPITGATGVTMVSCGKNMVNMLDAYPTNVGGVSIEKQADRLRVYTTSDGTYRGARLPAMLLRQGQPYTLSVRVTDITSGTIRVGFRNETTNSYLSGASVTFTAAGLKTLTVIPDKDVLAYPSMLVTSSTASAGDATFAEIQVEHGGNATSYEPYEGYTYRAEFGETVGGGVLDWRRGHLAVTHELLTFDGTEDWKQVSSGETAYWYLTLGPRGFADVTSEKCSHFGKVTITSSSTEIGCDLINSGTSDECRFTFRPGVEGVTSSDTWKEYLAAQAAAGTPVQVAYTLTSPRSVDVQPAHARLVKDNSGVATVFCDVGDLDVSCFVNLRWALSTLLDRVDRLEAELAALR